MLASKNRLKTCVNLSLFVTSYLPFLFIINFRHLYKNRGFLHWGGFSKQSILIFLEHFGVVSLLVAIAIVAVIGLKIFLTNIAHSTTSNGDRVQVKNIENKNSEAITYLFTYLVPFVFQDLSSIPDVISIFVLLGVTYIIYVNSTLILINPTLSMKYSLYAVEYTDDLSSNNPTVLKGILITKDGLLKENDYILIKSLGHKLFYATPFTGGENGN